LKKKMRHFLTATSGRGIHAAFFMKFALGAPTVQPPIPLPDDPRITFLSTCQQMYNEGAEMNHCVGWGHVENAIRGHAYYFHFEDADGRATVCDGIVNHWKSGTGFRSTQSNHHRFTPGQPPAHRLGKEPERLAGTHSGFRARRTGPIMAKRRKPLRSKNLHSE
jgi:hypothetical protein